MLTLTETAHAIRNHFRDSFRPKDEGETPTEYARRRHEQFKDCPRNLWGWGASTSSLNFPSESAPDENPTWAGPLLVGLLLGLTLIYPFLPFRISF